MAEQADPKGHVPRSPQEIVMRQSRLVLVVLIEQGEVGRSFFDSFPLLGRSL